MSYFNKMRIDTKSALYFGEKLISPYIYDSGEVQNGITVMHRGNTIDVFDCSTGEKKYSLHGVSSFKITDDVIIAYDGFLYRVYSFEGNIILYPIYSKIIKKGHYFIVTTKLGEIGLYKWKDNILCEIIKPNNFTAIKLNNSGIIVCKMVQGKTLRGYYSLNGKEILHPEYTEINFNSLGIHVTKEDESRGFLSYLGKEIVPPKYDNLQHYNNCFVVSKRGKNGRKYGLYTDEGVQVLKARYDKYIIKAPYVIFSLGELSCVYDLVTGKRILPLKYMHICICYNIIYATEDYRTFSIYSAKTGKKMLENKFQTVDIYDTYILKLKEGNKTYYYLTEHNALINSQEYDVVYSSDYRQVLMRSKKKENEWFSFIEWKKKKE